VHLFSLVKQLNITLNYSVPWSPFIW